MEDLRLFRMRLDRDAINNDALTDPMAGGRPHESHDLTFAWVARARSRPENRSRCDFSAALRRAAPPEKQQSNFKCNAAIQHAKRVAVSSLSLFSTFLPSSLLSSSLVIGFSLSTERTDLSTGPPRSPPANLPSSSNATRSSCFPFRSLSSTPMFFFFFFRKTDNNPRASTFQKSESILR